MRKISHVPSLWSVVAMLTVLSSLLFTPCANGALTHQDLETWSESQYGVVLGSDTSSGSGQVSNKTTTVTIPSDFALLAKAKPDECYYGPCSDKNFKTGTFPCPVKDGVPGVPRVNQAYVWGMTLANDGRVWFGTAPNTHCLVLGSYLGLSSALETSSYACEMGECATPMGNLGDWRPPEIYAYDPETKTLTNYSPPGGMGTTIGIRSAGFSDGLIFLAGPSYGGVTLFVYRTNGTFVGTRNLDNCFSLNLPEGGLHATDIRKWLTVDGTLYTTIGSSQGGRVLKWVGDASDPFQFLVVGKLDAGSGAELAYHEGKIFVNTWPSGDTLAGLFMSPDVPSGGLDASHADLWTKVWNAADYEPDEITGKTYGGGAMASFDGYLYWGTMHVPMVSLIAYMQAGVTLPEEALKAFWGSYRAISIFRGKNFGGAKEVDLVYGMPVLPKATQVSPGVYDWSIVPNEMGTLPLSGISGFGNMFNNYTWSMQVFGNKLWIGTMDWSYLVGDLLEGALKDQVAGAVGGTLPKGLAGPARCFYGADLFCLSSSQKPAFPLSISGLGNFTNYGVRNMLVVGDQLYFGMANPMNLLTDTKDDMPEGGWELRASGDLEVDGDLVPATEENLAPHNGDGNGDDIPDSTQSSVASIRAPGSSNYNTVEVRGSSECTQIRGVMALDENTLPADEEFQHPCGIMSINLQCPSLNGGTSTVRIYYYGYSSHDGWVYRKYGQTTPGGPLTWFTYPNATFGFAEVKGQPVLYADLTLTDNELGDILLYAAGGDGFIFDPGAPSFRRYPIPTLREWGMVALATLLAGISVWAVRRRRVL
ncbi:MAG: IPTL-CTERM sorting domain-containing protein [Pseudomonadota bacterium]